MMNIHITTHSWAMRQYQKCPKYHHERECMFVRLNNAQFLSSFVQSIEKRKKNTNDKKKLQWTKEPALCILNTCICIVHKCTYTQSLYRHRPVKIAHVFFDFYLDHLLILFASHIAIFAIILFTFFAGIWSNWNECWKATLGTTKRETTNI